MDIADKIHYLRNSLNMSKVNFGRKLKVSRITVHNWENGISFPTLYHITLIALLCDVTPDYLIYDDIDYQLNPMGLDDRGYELIQSMIKYFEANQDI